MKFLVISNLFPPCYLGGYEIGASWVCQGLKDQGHQVAVMTCRQLIHACCSTATALSLTMQERP
jgi:hypothetical protein